MKSIQLRHSDKVAMVDDEDYDLLEPMGWCYQSLGYAVKDGGSFTVNGKRSRSKLFMHRVILHAPEGSCVDHIDFNKLNNTRANLRLCSHSENVRHKRVQKNKSLTAFKGIYWRAVRKKWEASIFFGGRSHHLGHFTSETEAALAYNAAAAKHFGEFAHPNQL